MSPDILRRARSAWSNAGYPSDEEDSVRLIVKAEPTPKPVVKSEPNAIPDKKTKDESPRPKSKSKQQRSNEPAAVKQKWDSLDDSQDEDSPSSKKTGQDGARGDELESDSDEEGMIGA